MSDYDDEMMYREPDEDHVDVDELQEIWNRFDGLMDAFKAAPGTEHYMRSLNTSRGVIRDEALAELGQAELIRALKSQAVTHAKVFRSPENIIIKKLKSHKEERKSEK
nr:hypothetical protein BaRGS_029336 [Batillaria attramentaria]